MLTFSYTVLLSNIRDNVFWQMSSWLMSWDSTTHIVAVVHLLAVAARLGRLVAEVARHQVVNDVRQPAVRRAVIQTRHAHVVRERARVRVS